MLRLYNRTLTFFIHDNDLPLYTNVNLLANDTVQILKNREIHNLEFEVNHKLEIINHWMKINHSSLNCSKQGCELQLELEK